VEYRVEVEATKAGDFHFRTELTSANLHEPLTHEESTNAR
jgi:hypothetical protein